PPRTLVSRPERPPTRYSSNRAAALPSSPPPWWNSSIVGTMPMTEKTILYVDDEPDIRLIVEMALRLKAEFEVHGADSGQEALDLLRNGLKPDLILVDVMMPGLTGPDLLARVRENPDTKDLPVVFVTARARQQDVEQYIQQGAQGVITKPFDPMTLPDQLGAF